MAAPLKIPGLDLLGVPDLRAVASEWEPRPANGDCPADNKKLPQGNRVQTRADTKSPDSMEIDQGPAEDAVGVMVDDTVTADPTQVSETPISDVKMVVAPEGSTADQEPFHKDHSPQNQPHTLDHNTISTPNINGNAVQVASDSSNKLPSAAVNTEMEAEAHQVSEKSTSQPTQPPEPMEVERPEKTIENSNAHMTAEGGSILDALEAAIGGLGSTELQASRPSHSQPMAMSMEEGEVEDGNDQNQNAEWEADSSPYESSSDDSSSDSSDDSNADDDAYVGLTTEEMARILIEQDSHEEQQRPTAAQIRTANEKPEEVIPKPDIQVKPEMKIECLGEVLHLVENTVVVKGATPGEYQVLDSGSVVCSGERAVLGVIADVIGRVQEPMYTIRFTNAQEIQEAGLTPGAKVYYPVDLAAFVFTKPLIKLKGTDASNLWDEEVGEDEQEFSDDEQEREHKRKKREAARGRRSSISGGKGPLLPFARNETKPDPGLNYDDDDGPYQPLARPAGYVGGSAAEEPLPGSTTFRGRGGGSRGGRGRGRGQQDGGFRGGRGDGRDGGSGGRGDRGSRGRRADGGRGRGRGGKFGRDGQAGHGHDERRGEYHDRNNEQRADSGLGYPQPQTSQYNGYANSYDSGSNALYPSYIGSPASSASGFGPPPLNFHVPRGGNVPPAPLPFNFPHGQGPAGQNPPGLPPQVPFNFPFPGQGGPSNTGHVSTGLSPIQGPGWPQAPPSHQFAASGPTPAPLAGGPVPRFPFPVPPPPPAVAGRPPNPADNAALQRILDVLKHSTPQQ